uniref:c-type cytochrome n=1 Tax=Brevirhabdus pacifica TaxID=1267768 RepID=UPI001E400FA3
RCRNRARRRGPDQSRLRAARSDNPFIPRLDIQPPEYLLHALETYADESRGSGFMLQAVSMVSPAALAELAAHYGAVAPEGGHGDGKGGEPERRDPGFAKKDVEPSLMAGPEPKEKRKGEELIARGRALAEGRAGDTRVPACTACHGPVETGQEPPAELEADFPALAGQHRTFLESQLILWRKSLRGGGKAAELMWQAARDLTDADISALSAYFASLPPQKLPVARGPGVVPR